MIFVIFKLFYMHFVIINCHFLLDVNVLIMIEVLICFGPRVRVIRRDEGRVILVYDVVYGFIRVRMFGLMYGLGFDGEMMGVGLLRICYRLKMSCLN